jgi:predicted AAA+ superfamily ATPase
MVDYIARTADASIRRALRTFGGVVVEGARAAGKTTTALRQAQSSVRMDASPELVALAEVAPDEILAGRVPRLIDEWQLAPTLWNAARHAVDDRGLPGQFLLTGSATPADDVTRHSGAGRFGHVRLRTLSLAESGESLAAVPFADVVAGRSVSALGGPSVRDYAGYIARGGWPALVRDPDRLASEYLRSYLSDIARVDIPASDLRVDPLRMRALIDALARNVATEVSAARLGRDARVSGSEPGEDPGIAAATVRRYLDALARVNVLEEQPAWRPHLRSAVRQRVSPKWHFVDPSLAAAALDAGVDAMLADPETLGFLFESLAVRDLRIYAEALGATVSHYRDETGLEVDAIVELPGGRWAAFEVKLGGTKAIDAAAEHLQMLAGKVDAAHRERLSALVVLTAGAVSLSRPDGVSVVALGHLAAPGL